jgi:hypothetical protein
VSKRSRVEPPLEYFVDRSLGSEIVPTALREAGLTVHRLVELYPGHEDVDDNTWIADCTAQGWVLLTKDKRIRHRQAEIDAVKEAGARMFCIPSGNLTGRQMADRLVHNRHRIAQRAGKRGPYIYLVHADRLERIYPPT